MHPHWSLSLKVNRSLKGNAWKTFCYLRPPLWNIVFIVFCCFLLICSPRTNPGLQLPIRKAKGENKIDGVLDEADWQTGLCGHRFSFEFSVDTPSATSNGRRVTSQRSFLFVSFICHDDDKPYIVQSLKRDFDFDNNDNMTVRSARITTNRTDFFSSSRHTMFKWKALCRVVARW